MDKPKWPPGYEFYPHEYEPSAVSPARQEAGEGGLMSLRGAAPNLIPAGMSSEEYVRVLRSMHEQGFCLGLDEAIRIVRGYAEGHDTPTIILQDLLELRGSPVPPSVSGGQPEPSEGAVTAAMRAMADMAGDEERTIEEHLAVLFGDDVVEIEAQWDSLRAILRAAYAVDFRAAAPEAERRGNEEVNRA